MKKINLRHLRCHCKAHTRSFLHLMILVSHKYICIVLKESKWSDKFQKVYVKDGWDCWHITVSETPGVVPWNQVIESMHQSQMKTIITKNHLRQPIGTFLDSSLPLLLHTASKNIQTYINEHGLTKLMGNVPTN